MNGRAFIDTNILVYLYSLQEPDKRNICIAELDKYTRVVSTQILNELSNVLFKKYRLKADDVRKHVENVKRLAEISAVELSTIDKAITLQGRYGFSYYDCLMLTSALDEDCEVVLTEDLSDGQIVYGRLKIVNPFKSLLV